MTKRLHAIFSAHAHQKFAVAAKIACAKGGAPIKISDVAKHLAPLAGEQIDNIDPFRLPFQQRGRRAEKVDMGIGCHPTLLAPVQNLPRAVLRSSPRAVYWDF